MVRSFLLFIVLFNLLNQRNQELLSCLPELYHNHPVNQR